MAFVSEEVAEDSLVEAVEGWVTETGAVNLESAGDEAVLVLAVVVEAEDVAVESVDGAVEAGVAGVVVAFDDVAEVVEALWGVETESLAFVVVDESAVDSGQDAGLDVLSFVYVFVFVEGSLAVAVAAGHWDSVSVDQVGEVAGGEGLVEVEVFDFTHTVAQTLQVVAGHDLLVDVVVEFSTDVFWHVHVAQGDPEGEEVADVVVVVVKTYIVGEV